MSVNLNTTKIPTWCPGCHNFSILASVKKIIGEEIEKGKKQDDFAICAGIGCHARIFDYINLNGISTLHGRVLPTCIGMKVGNPNLTIFGFSGDGDAYAEGMEHLIHAARYNSDINYIVHNNRTFALTVGQNAPTTEEGFKSKSNPLGVGPQPLNPIALMLASGASFVARTFSGDLKQMQEILREAMKHKGFSFVEILQPCLIFHNTDYRDKVYSLKNHDKSNFEEAMKRALEFDYNSAEKIPTGIFYQKERTTFEDNFEQLRKLKKEKKSWRDIKR